MNEIYSVNKKENYTLFEVLVPDLTGSLTVSLKSELLMTVGNGEKNIIIDLNQVNECDSDGIRALLIADRLCKNSKGRLIITGVQPTVDKQIINSQLEDTLTLARSRKQAEIMIQN